MDVDREDEQRREYARLQFLVSELLDESQKLGTAAQKGGYNSQAGQDFDALTSAALYLLRLSARVRPPSLPHDPPPSPF